MSSEAVGGQRTFQTLDGLRGLAALIVVTRHAPPFFPTGPFPESWLAVDLFFLLSGFVIAHSYEARLKAGGFFWTFVKIRVIRLYPLYLLGAGLAFLDAVARRQSLHFDRGELAQLLVAVLFMLPTVPGFMGVQKINGPTWTLLPELVANLVYAALVRRLGTVLLLAFSLIGAVGILQSIRIHGSFWMGWEPPFHWVGFSRVAYAFFAGVLIYRLRGRLRRVSSPLALVLMGLAMACLTYTPTEVFKPYFEAFAVFVVFPLLLTIACQVEPGPRLASATRFLGLTSYAVYVLHEPLGKIAAAVFGHVSQTALSSLAPTPGLIFVAAVAVVSAVLDKVYDNPVRRWLTGRFVRRPQRLAN